MYIVCIVIKFFYRYDIVINIIVLKIDNDFPKLSFLQNNNPVTVSAHTIFSYLLLYSIYTHLQYLISGCALTRTLFTIVYELLIIP